MIQEFKSIEEIKNDVIQQTLTNGVGGLEEFTTEVAKRFSQQYIDANKELVEMLEELLKELRFHGFNYSTAICKAESLIAKNK